MTSTSITNTHESVQTPAPFSDVLGVFEEAGLIQTADRHIAVTLARLTGERSPTVVLAAALASRAPRFGHVAVDLATVATTAIAETVRDRNADTISDPIWPEPTVWIAQVADSPLVSVLSDARDIPDPGAPLVLVGSLLYLQKYWVYERCVAEQLIERSGRDDALWQVDEGLTVAPKLLTGEGSQDQLRAVSAGLSRGLTVLVGGPGTGKTTTVAALVAEILSRISGDQTLAVALAAPTGKAAARLAEAFAAAASALPADLSARLHSVEASTIHRLLGASWQSPTQFRHHRGRPLPQDLVIVDEASMISMPLMARLLDAVRPDARCVIVGDPGQLASVEAGSVLADIASAGNRPVDGGSSEADQRVITLRHSRRFPGDSPIGRLAHAIGDGDVVAALHVLRDPASAQASAGAVSWIEHPGQVNPLDHPETKVVVGSLWRPHLQRIRTAAETGEAGRALNEMMAMRVLCAHRQGPFGVQTWNRVAGAWSQRQAESADTVGGGDLWYPGKVVMVTANDERLGLFNGDLGVAINHEGQMRVAIESASGVRLIPPGQLESLETASAMTIHKSQGSEFDHVVVVLPSADSRLATRELLYTGVTRAKAHMTLVASEAVIAAAITTRITRASGLQAQLW
jgi:exodeoxyribonuclease V alpha subunit